MDYIVNKTNQLLDTVLKSGFAEQLKQKEANATPEEKKQLAQIREKLAAYKKAGDTINALKYLNHLKATLSESN